VIADVRKSQKATLFEQKLKPELQFRKNEYLKAVVGVF